jgi:hypothetical protein
MQNNMCFLIHSKDIPMTVVSIPKNPTIASASDAELSAKSLAAGFGRIYQAWAQANRKRRQVAKAAADESNVYASMRGM